MPEFLIDAVDDPRLDVYRDLKHTGSRQPDTFIAEGEKLVLRLLGSPCRTESIVCTAAMQERLHGRVPAEVPIYITSTPNISRLIGFQFHRGVLACGLRPKEKSLESLLESHSAAKSLLKKGTVPLGSIDLPQKDHSWERDGPLFQQAARRSLVVLCPEIRDPVNLGTIIRTAAAFGAVCLVAGRAGTEPFSRRVLRTSMGSVLQLAMIQTDAWAEVFETLHGHDFDTIAAVIDTGAESLTASLPSAHVALLLGNEDAGLSDELVARCRRRVRVPMAGGVDSLNVAVAAGIIMHHFAS